MPDDWQNQSPDDYFRSQGLVLNSDGTEWVRPPSPWVDSTPIPLQNPDASPADIAAYRTTRAVKGKRKLPVEDDRGHPFGPIDPTRPSYVIEPDLQEAQGGQQFPPGLMQNDAGQYYYADPTLNDPRYGAYTGQNVPVVKRPGLLPIASTPEGLKLVMPKMLDLTSNVMGNVGGVMGGKVAAKAGEMVLGSGMVRKADQSNIWYHGTASGDLRGGESGLHLGTQKAAQQALEARIGIPADGKGWSGNREYGKTLLAGRKTLEKMDPKGYNKTGFNAKDLPEEDFYPSQILKYADKTEMPMTVKPSIDAYKIKGNMTNTVNNPHEDFKANGYMRAQITKGNPKNGYYYTNQGEDSGSISAVVPNGNHLEKVLKSDTRNQVAGQVGHQVEHQVNQQGFYSALQTAVSNAKVDKADAAQWLGYLKNQPWVKSEEINTVLKNLPEGQISRSQLEDIVKQNKVELGEKVLGDSEHFQLHYKDTLPRRLTLFGPVLDEIKDVSDIALAKRHNSSFKETVKNVGDLKAFEAVQEAKKLPNFDKQLGQFDTRAEAEAAIKNLKGEEHIDIAHKRNNVDTKYHSYQLPGGENYKEMLLKLPEKKINTEGWRAEKDPQGYKNDWLIYNKAGDVVSMRNAPNAEQAIEKALTNLSGYKPNNFQSSHWDEPNVLAHIRMNDRNVEGKKVLHVEEIQSDWGQGIRKNGFKGEKEKLEPEFNKIEQKIIDSNDEKIMGQPKIEDALKMAVDKNLITKNEADLYKRYTDIENGNPLPDMPFKKSWTQLAVRRILHKAATEGYEGVSYTPGELQAARYDLSKQVDHIDYRKKGDKYELGIVGKNGEGINLPKDRFTEKELEEHVGKEVAEKIINGEGKAGGGRMTLSNVDLKIGGEGMKQFYDKIVKDEFNNIGKKYGSKIEPKEIETDKYVAGAKAGQRQKQAVPYFNITPEMREKAKGGFPLFSSSPTLSPITHNPFAEDEKKRYKLVPIQGNPFQE